MTNRHSEIITMTPSTLSDLVRALSGPNDIGAHIDGDEVVEYLYGELGADKRQLVEAHLRHCSQCSAIADQVATAADVWTPDGQENVEDDSHRESTVSAFEATFKEWLTSVGSLETEGDYELPNGLHSSVHVNVAKLCDSEELLMRAARYLLAAIGETEFDSVLACTWPVAFLVKRALGLLGVRKPILRCEGYRDPRILGHIKPYSKILVVTDVVVTGRQLRTIVDRIAACRGSLAAVITLVEDSSAPQVEPPYRSLCRLDLGLSPKGSCVRCGRLRAFEWNPVAACMTVKKVNPRTPSDYLALNPEAETFWQLVNTARAYKPHEEVEGVHYLSFFNFERLLNDETAGPRVIELLSEKLRGLIGNRNKQFCLVPNRERAVDFANKLKVYARAQLNVVLELVYADRVEETWHLDPASASRIHDQPVIILDCAASYGDTLDDLWLEAYGASCVSIGALLIVSRMSDPQEATLGKRFNGGFARLHQQSVRPQKTSSAIDCEYCRRSKELLRDADDSGIEILVARANRVRAAWKGMLAREHSPAEPKLRQIPLLGLDPLLNSCEKEIASGVTVNALFGAMNDGMAPLSLSEIRNAQIPVENRAAMLEWLPSGVIAWSGKELHDEVFSVLKESKLDDLWIAASGVLYREGDWQWTLVLEERLRTELPTWRKDSWTKLVDHFYAAMRGNHGLRSEMRRRLPRSATEKAGARGVLLQAVDAAELG